MVMPKLNILSFEEKLKLLTPNDKIYLKKIIDSMPGSPKHKLHIPHAKA